MVWVTCTVPGRSLNGLDPWIPLAGCPRLEDSINELQPVYSQRLLVPVPLGSCNKSQAAWVVHNSVLRVIFGG